MFFNNLYEGIAFGAGVNDDTFAIIAFGYYIGARSEVSHH
jgi:hypothetical protein